MSELSYKLEEDAQKFMLLLEQISDFVTYNNLLTIAADLKKLADLKEKIAQYKATNLNLVTYNFKSLYKTGMTFIHPDKYDTLQSENLKKQIEEFTAAINSIYQNLASDLNKAKQTNVTEAFKSQFTGAQNNSSTNNNDYQNNERQQYTEQRSYYQQQSSYGSRPNYRQSTYNSKPNYEQTQTEERQYHYHAEDDFEEEIQYGFGELIRSRWNAVFKKIPSNEQDFINIKNFYLKKIAIFKTKIAKINFEIEKNAAQINKSNQQWETELFPNNVQKVYNERERKLYADYLHSCQNIDAIFAELKNRFNTLTPLIMQKQQAFLEYYNSFVALYNKEMQFVQSGANRELYYSNYPETNKTYAEVLQEKYNFLISHNDLNQEYEKIKNDILRQDQVYQELDKKYVVATSEAQEKEFKHKNYRSNYEIEVKRIVAEINHQYNSKLCELTNIKNSLVKKVQALIEKRDRAIEQYNVYLARYQSTYDTEQKRGRR